MGAQLYLADDSDSESASSAGNVWAGSISETSDRGARVERLCRRLTGLGEPNPTTTARLRTAPRLSARLPVARLNRVGWYRFYFSDERWEWSPEVEQIHGYQPGTITPTTQLVLLHKHPDDYEYIAATLEDIRQSRRRFSSRHRIITVQGDTRDIVVIGERLRDDSGEVIGTQGFYIDVTRADESREATISAAVADFAEHRATIEQATGVLMYVYRIDSTAAFELLKWRSQETNTKLRTLAEQLLADVHTLKQNDPCPDRATVDQLLLTAHHRGKTKAATRERS
jgi:PAS domain S-box-containing protein